MTVGLLAGCGKQNEQTASDKTRLRVVTTIFPEYDWVREILGDKADPLADRIKEEAVNDALSSALATLRPNEKDILERHFGLNGRPVQSLMAIGEVYGLTSERIRQIESAALQKMRQVFGKNGLHGKN